MLEWILLLLILALRITVKSPNMNYSHFLTRITFYLFYPWKYQKAKIKTFPKLTKFLEIWPFKHLSMYPGLQTRGVLAGFACWMLIKIKISSALLFGYGQLLKCVQKKERKKINEIDRGDSVVWTLQPVSKILLSQSRFGLSWKALKNL